MAVMNILLVLAGVLTGQIQAEKRACDIRFTFQNKLAQHLQPTRAVNGFIVISGSFLQATQGMSSEDFLTATSAQIESDLLRFSQVNDLPESLALPLLLDIEYPFKPGDIGELFRRWVEVKDPTILRFASALRLRVAAAQKIFYNADIGLYGFPMTSTSEGVHWDRYEQGIRYLFALDVFDSTDFISLLAYPRFGETDLKKDGPYIQRGIRLLQSVLEFEKITQPVYALTSFQIANGNSNHNGQQVDDQALRGLFNKLRSNTTIDSIVYWQGSETQESSLQLQRLNPLAKDCSVLQAKPFREGIVLTYGGASTKDDLLNPLGVKYSHLVNDTQMSNYVRSGFDRARNRGVHSLLLHMPNGWPGLQMNGTDGAFGRQEYLFDPQGRVSLFHEHLGDEIQTFLAENSKNNVGVYLSGQKALARDLTNCHSQVVCPYSTIGSTRADQRMLIDQVSGWYRLGVRHFFFDHTSPSSSLSRNLVFLSWLRQTFPGIELSFEAIPGLDAEPDDPFSFSELSRHWVSAALHRFLDHPTRRQFVVHSHSRSTFAILSNHVSYDAAGNILTRPITQALVNEYRQRGLKILSLSVEYDQFLP